MEIKGKDRRTALRTLSDEIFQLAKTAKKVHFIVGKIYNEAFSNGAPSTEEELMQFAIKYESLEQQIDILLDYTVMLHNDLRDLDTIAIEKPMNEEVA